MLCLLLLKAESPLLLLRRWQIWQCRLRSKGPWAQRERQADSCSPKEKSRTGVTWWQNLPEKGLPLRLKFCLRERNASKVLPWNGPWLRPTRKRLRDWESLRRLLSLLLATLRQRLNILRPWQKTPHPINETYCWTGSLCIRKV